MKNLHILGYIYKKGKQCLAFMLALSLLSSLVTPVTTAAVDVSTHTAVESGASAYTVTPDASAYALDENPDNKYLSSVEFFLADRENTPCPKLDDKIVIAQYVNLQVKITRTNKSLDKKLYGHIYVDGKKADTSAIHINANKTELSKKVSIKLKDSTNGVAYINLDPYKQDFTKEEHTISLVYAPTQSNFSIPDISDIPNDNTYEIYNYTFIPTVALYGLRVNNLDDVNEAEISCTNENGFNPTATYLGDANQYTTAARNVKITALVEGLDGEKSCATLHYRRGNNEEWIQSSTMDFNVDLDECKTEDTKAIVYVKVTCGRVERVSPIEFTLLPVEESYAPDVTEHPASQTCDKGQAQPLHITVENNNGDNITYQWQSSWYDGSFFDIPDETGNTYTPQDTIAGTTYYRCLAKKVKDGKIYTAKSNSAKVTINLSSVNKPIPFKDFGSYTYDKSGNVTASVKTEFESGKKFNPIFVRMPSVLEPGTRLKFEALYNTEDSLDTAKRLDAAITSPSSGNDENGAYENYTITPKEGIHHLGDYYVYCKITAVSLDGAKESEPYIGTVKLTFTPSTFTWPHGGAGSSSDPYPIQTLEDLVRIREEVNTNNNQLTSLWFRLENDITLPVDWVPIGNKVNDKERPFAGLFDGNKHKITVSSGGKPLFMYVRDTVIKDLDIYGEDINGCGLIDGSFIDYGEDGDYWTGTPNAATITNVRLLENSKTRRSGIIEGSGSGANTIILRNCVVEKGVTVGGPNEIGVGSFSGGGFNGRLESCYSYANVLGQSNVGGLVGGKGQSMGLCEFTNCGFIGNIQASRDWVGGIIGKGYTNVTAPNTMPVSFNNCFVNADITANDYIGGIFGGEGGLKDALNECILSNSSFYGSINSNGTHVGGIIGHYEGINTLQKMENNYFYETNNKTLPVIGTIGGYVFTDKSSFANQAAADEWYQNTGKAMTKADYTSGKVTEQLNTGSATTLKNWIQDPIGGYPVHSSQAVVISLTIGGKLEKKHYIGDSLQLAGLTFTAALSDGTTEAIPAEQIKITGYDPNTPGSQTVKASYGAVSAELTVVVLQEGTISVKFALYGDTAHGPNAGVSHTLSGNNLTRWIPAGGTDEFVTYYNIDANATVKDVLE